MRDLTNLARVGLLLIAISLFIVRSPVGLIPLAMSLLLPRFRVLGWWITIVLTLFLLSATAGQAIFLARAPATSPPATQPTTQTTQPALQPLPPPDAFTWSVIAARLAGAALTLLGLLAKGTRHAVEQRTRAVAPNAFDR